MHRFAVILLVGGVVLLVSWIAAPAAPNSAGPAAADPAAPDQSAVVAEVNAQVERLRKQLSTPAPYPPPVRNPFRFSGRPEPRRIAPKETAAPPVEPPAPSLPALLAITATSIDGTLVRTGVLRVDDDVKIVKAGDTIGSLVVRSVEADAIELLDPTTSKIYRVVLQ